MELLSRKKLFESFSKIKLLSKSENYVISKSGGITITMKKLTTLEDLEFPDELEYFDCSDNELKNLKGSPQKILTHYWCDCNDIISLEGAPTYVGGDFSCLENPNLTLEEINKYKKTGAVKGTIIHDYDL